MSRTSLKQNKRNIQKATAGVSPKPRRSVVVFDSASPASVKETVLLYKLVFRTKKATWLALFFCICFLSQPFQAVFAAEEPTVPDIEVPAEPVVTVETVEPVLVGANEEPAAAEVSDNAEVVDIVTTDESEVSEAVTETELETVLEPVTETEAVPVVDTTSVPEAELPVDEAGGDHNAEPQITDDEANIIDPFYYYPPEAPATSPSDSEGQFVENLHVVAVMDSDSAFSFSRDECTRIEDGSFYCQENVEANKKADGLVAAPDQDGDLEIFLVRDGGEIQVTHNTVDDASPYYDETSKTLVWHRLIDDRYQIISYDPETGEEYQLTDGVINNMEPSRQGDFVVWQRWVNDNWEIILNDGKQELQITSSSDHDTAPHIRGSLIIWNTQAPDGTHTLRTYDIETKAFTTITDSDGVSVSNPRMVVMYEALYENGDVIMKGFDLVTGEVIPLNAIPRDLPEEIPDTDSTGETRALIQNKPSLRDEGVQDVDDPDGLLIIPPLDEIDPYTLDLSSTTFSGYSEPGIDEYADIPTLVIPPTSIEASLSTQVL